MNRELGRDKLMEMAQSGEINEGDFRLGLSEKRNLLKEIEKRNGSGRIEIGNVDGKYVVAVWEGGHGMIDEKTRKLGVQISKMDREILKFSSKDGLLKKEFIRLVGNDGNEIGWVLQSLKGDYFKRYKD